MPHPVDHAAIKTGQISAIIILLFAAGLDRWEPVAGLAVAFLVTALAWEFGPFALIYRFALKPLGLVQPDIRPDNLQPHRFGQAIGAVSAMAAAAALYQGYAIIGWALVGVLVVLTAISFMGWCIGCFIYYQMNRLGLGGFFNRAPADNGVPLGARPRRDV